MYILDPKSFKKALKNKGYHSIGALAKTLGVHRNTIHYYLSGNGVFPEGFEKIIHALDIKPYDFLVEKTSEDTFSLEAVAPLIDTLHLEFPNITFVLFGSRSRGRAHKYSDWDIGVFVESGLPHELYRKILQRKNELAEDLPFFVDIVNLNRADGIFLKEASHHWTFLAGKTCDWVALQRKVAA